MQRYFAFSPSLLLTLLLVAAHAMVMGTLFFLLPFPRTALLVLLTILMGSMVYHVRRDARLTLDCSWVALRLEDDIAVLINRKGDEFTGELKSSSVVTPYLVVLDILLPDQRWMHNVVIVPDSMEAESFRQLRVALRWGLSPSV